MPTVYSQVCTRYEGASFRKQEHGRSLEIIRHAQPAKHGTLHPCRLDIGFCLEECVGHCRSDILEIVSKVYNRGKTCPSV